MPGVALGAWVASARESVLRGRAEQFVAVLRGRGRRRRPGRGLGAAAGVRVPRRRRPALGTICATDLLWVFNDPAHYNSLVLQCGWPEAEFTAWLSSQMRHALLPT